MSNFESGPVNLNDDGKQLRWEDAAKRVVVEGFACVKCGRFYGDGDSGERAARYCCHTDAPCECGNRKDRRRVLCESCYHKSKIKRWDGLEQSPWDGKAMLTTLDGDEYFSDTDRLIEWCLDHKIAPSDSFVIHCEERGPPELCLSELVWSWYPDYKRRPTDAELLKWNDEYRDAARAANERGE